METRAFIPPPGFVDLLLDAVCVVDREGRFLFASAACERIFGYRPDEMVGTLMIDMVAPEDRARTLAAARQIMTGDARFSFENCYLRKDGRKVHILWSARWSPEDAIRIAVAHDITERKRSESVQAALYAISESVHLVGDLDALYPQIHRIVNELLPAPGFSIALLDPSRDRVEFSYHIDRNGPPSATHRGLCELVIARGEPLLLNPRSQAPLPEALRDAMAERPACWLGMPLVTDNGITGVLSITDNASGSASYTERDQELLQFVSTQIATAIERKRLQSQLRHMAQHDILTGLPNRMLLLDRLDTALARARRDQQGFSLLFVDLDQFKPINDVYGHETGDRLLQEVARRLSQCVRDSDTVARVGGDEFVVLLDRACTLADAELVAAKIRSELCSAIRVRELALHIAPSIGVAVFPEHGDSAQQLLNYADGAMYRVKREARRLRH
ncbi:MAG TPA: diguanylate cyclase [Telluria sp.]